MARRLRNVTTLSTGDIGRALNARFLVNGTVRRSEERLGVTVELVRAATGARVWGDQYDRSAEDLLVIEALAAVAVGMPDVAIGILERAWPHGPWLWSYLIFPGFDPLRDDPRFIKIFDEAKPAGAPEVPR